MTRFQPRIQIICADSVLTETYLREMGPCCAPENIVSAQSVAGAQRNFRHGDPSVILLDESAMQSADRAGLESTVATLTAAAPVVVVAASERQSELAFLITSGAADFVVRSGHFVAVAVGLVERRVHLADYAASIFASGGEGHDEDFGEILRHEVNNPLTGILGNAELLLARREGLSPAAVIRVETIAELAVRLRETVRRLSSAWTVRHDHVSP